MYDHGIIGDCPTDIDVHFIYSKVSILPTHYWNAQLDDRPYARLYYIKNGRGFFESFGKRHELRPGYLFLIPPRGGHAYGCVEELEIWWVHFSATAFSAIDLFDYLSYDMEHEITDLEFDEHQMKRMIDSAMAPSVSTQFEARGILLQFLSRFMHNPSGHTHARRQAKLLRFAPVLSFIDEHLAERITIDRLAAIAHYEKAHFTKLFTDLFGLPPSRYMNRRRIDRVQLILRSTDATLDQIAEELGFSDAFHLSKTFKKYMGISPREYRRSQVEIVP